MSKDGMNRGGARPGAGRKSKAITEKLASGNPGGSPLMVVEHSHKAIIDPEEWERVQLEPARRKGSTKRTYCNSPFAAKLVCGDCGEHYGSKVWHSNSKYRRTIWRCNAKYRDTTHCSTPHLYEDDLKRHFITALSELLRDRESLLEDGRFVRRELLDFAVIDSECTELAQEMDVISDMIKKLVSGNATQAVGAGSAGDHLLRTPVERHHRPCNGTRRRAAGLPI